MTAPLPTRTRAWSMPRYGAAETLVRGDRALAPPGPGEVLIEVEAASVNPFDLKLMSGQLERFIPLQFPFSPGGDVVGRVLAAGPDVTRFRAGDRVAGLTFQHGTMAHHRVLPVNDSLAAAPSELAATDIAALPEVGLTAMAILRALRSVSGRRIALIGAAGGIGLMLVQMASQAGAHVIGTAMAVDAARVRDAGAAETIDYTAGDTLQVLRERYPAGVDAVVDLVTQFEPLLAVAQAVRDGGALVSPLFGPDPSAFPRGIEASYIRVSPQPGDFDRLMAEAASGRLKANVTRVFDFDEVPLAYAALRDEHVVGKIAVEMKSW
jgi:NADPH:quinone reductase